MRNLSVALLAGAVCFALASGAQASTLTFSDGPGTGEVAINLTGAADAFSTTGLASGITVDLSSTQQVDFANGVATVNVHGNGTFSNLTITAPGFTFTDLDFRAQFGSAGGGTITATDQSGSTSSTIIGPGADELVLTSSSALTALTLSSPNGFQQLKQIEISGLTATPLPGAVALLGPALGLGYLGLRRRRRPRIAA